MTIRQLGKAGATPDAAARLLDIAAAVHPGYVSGRWYTSLGAGGPGAAVQQATSILRLVPIYIKSSATVAALGIRTTAVSVASNVTGYLYASDPTSRRPTGAPLASSASTAISTTAGVITMTLSTAVTLAAGWYWIGIAFSATPTVVCIDGSDPAYVATQGAATLATAIVAASTTINSLSIANTYGTALTLTSSSTFTEQSSGMPSVAFQVNTTG